MYRFPKDIQAAIDQFIKLPGIGPKTAERLVFYLIGLGKPEIEQFSQALNSLSTALTYCSSCHMIGEKDPCSLCADPARNTGVICVVADPHDQAAIESTKAYSGRYHILGGVINPLDGVTPSMLAIDSLKKRITSGGITEVILALNPDMQGETTMLYLKNLLKEQSVKVTRLARGLPVGADLEYSDEITLTSALKNRSAL